MKKNKKGFIAISVIYSFFILFITVMMLIMYSYINDRKTNLKIKSELLDRFRDKSPDISISQNGSILPHDHYDVTINILDGGNGISTAKYAWSESPSAAATIDLPSYNEVVTSPTEKGNYYLVVTACDVNMFCKTIYTTTFNVGQQNKCLKANTLHNESCINEDPDGYCLGDGLEANSTSIFGTMNLSSNLQIGDAYDCDVNGDNIYDPTTERFYYLSDYYNTDTKTYDVTKAVLIYSNNVHSGTINNTTTTAYTNASADAPSAAALELPTTSQWSNVSLFTSLRSISAETGYDIPTDINYSGEEVAYVAPVSGTYKIELWGAQGGRSMGEGTYTHANSLPGGKGGYTSGNIHLEEGDTIYINVGGKGEDAINAGDAAGGWNGGGSGTHDHSEDESAGGGGGATDVRLVSRSSQDAFESLASRIMVAAGGGGAAYAQTGGYAGGLNGEKAYYGTSATQEEGYAFGQGQNGVNVIENVEVAGGGGGYWGGYAVSDTQNNRYKSAGGGGSSYVSGYIGCKAIAEVSTSTNVISTLTPIHFSGKRFTNGVIKAGNESMPDYNSNGKITGNTGDGHARITLVGAADESEILGTFTYPDRAARLPHFKEMLGCLKYKTIVNGDNIDLSVGSINSKCSFLLENTKYNTYGLSEGYLLENLYSDHNYVWYLDSSNASITGGTHKTTNNKYGVRPVIEVEKTLMEIY